MKVILLVDDKKLGKKNTIVEVADGYANNVLLPRKIAVKATKQNISRAALQVAKDKYEDSVMRINALKLADKLTNEIKEITLTLRCAYSKKNHSIESRKIFGSITSEDISNKLKKDFNIDIDKKDIYLSNKIKDLGCYKIVIKLYSGITSTLLLNVDAEYIN